MIQYNRATMSIVKKTVSIATAFVAAGLLSVAVVPLASADADQSEATTSTRSFPKVTTVRKDLLSESTSTEVDGGADWGGIESLDVPQTKSPAEIAAEAEAAEQARQQAAAAAAAAASRSS